MQGRASQVDAAIAVSVSPQTRIRAPFSWHVVVYDEGKSPFFPHHFPLSLRDQ